jgi:hypothetical protein
MPAITEEQLVAGLKEALANKPADTYSDEGLEWFADVAGMVAAYRSGAAVRLRGLLSRISEVDAGNEFFSHLRYNAVKEFYIEARTIYTTLRLQTNSFTTAQVSRGQVHDYFEEVRQLIGASTTDILFIDPYIDAEFVERYLPQIPAGVSVRLLTSTGRVASLAPALALYRQQHQAVQVELRAMPNKAIHDRHLVVDGREVYQSGASFKDGAKNAPTTINQIVDVAPQIISAHESTWAGASIVT